MSIPTWRQNVRQRCCILSNRNRGFYFLLFFKKNGFHFREASVRWRLLFTALSVKTPLSLIVFLNNFSRWYTYLLILFSVLHSLIVMIVPLLSIPPETITLQTNFQVISLHSNLLDTVRTVLVIRSYVSCHNGRSEGKKVLRFWIQASSDKA